MLNRLNTIHECDGRAVKSSALQEHCWPGSSRNSRAGFSLSSRVCISHQSWSCRSAYHRGLCSGLCCLPSTAARWPGDIITDHGVHYHQYADDTQLHLAMSADSTAVGLSVLAACTDDVSGTCTTACSSTRTGGGSSRQQCIDSSALMTHPHHQYPSPVAENNFTRWYILDRK